MDYIQKTVKEIRFDKWQKNMSETDIQAKYKMFEKQYPTLFRMILNNDDRDGENMKKLDKMIELHTMVKQCEITYEKATEKMGKELFDEYVQPMLERST